MNAYVENSGIERRGRPLWRNVLLCLALMAFTLQTYVGLTHIHQIAPTHEAQVSLPSDGAPGHEPAVCPVCTHAQMTGHFLMPGGFAAAAPFLAVQVVSLATAPAIFPATVSHIWRGRGPPNI